MKYLKEFDKLDESTGINRIWNAFKVGKSRLYDKSRGLKKRSSNVPIYTFHALKVPSNKLVDDYRVVNVRDVYRDGTFYMHSSGSSLGFKSKVYSDEMWFDAEPIFKRLHKIGDELGYKLGTSVYSETLKMDTKIVDIVDFAFYEHSGGYSGYIKPVFTLLYKLEGSNQWYQVTDIDLIKPGSSNNIVDVDIMEQFYDLIDEGVVSYTSNKKSQKGKTIYDCVIKINHISTSNLLKISEALSVAEARLNDNNIGLRISSIQSHEIRFVCYEKDSGYEVD